MPGAGATTKNVRVVVHGLSSLYELNMKRRTLGSKYVEGYTQTRLLVGGFLGAVQEGGDKAVPRDPSSKNDRTPVSEKSPQENKPIHRIHWGRREGSEVPGQFMVI
jgi:hypothetical protein